MAEIDPPPPPKDPPFKICADLHARLRDCVNETINDRSGANTQENYIPALKAILYLVQDLRNPVNKEDDIIVSLPSNHNKELVDMIGLTTCMLQDLQAEAFRKYYNNGIILKGDGRTLVTTVYQSTHLVKEKALDGVKGSTTTRGRKPSKKSSTARRSSSAVSPSGQRQRLKTELTNICFRLGLDEKLILTLDTETKVTNFRNLKQVDLLNDYNDEHSDSKSLIDKFIKKQDELKQDKTCLSNLKNERSQQKERAETEFCHNLGKSKDDLNDEEKDDMADAVKGDEQHKKLTRDIDKLKGKGKLIGSIARKKEQKDRINKAIADTLESLKQILHNLLLVPYERRASTGAMPTSPPRREPIPRRRSSEAPSVEPYKRLSPALVAKKLEKVMLHCASDLEALDDMTVQDLCAIHSVKELMKQDDAMTSEIMNAIFHRLKDPARFKIEAQLKQWATTHVHLHMRGRMYGILQMGGDAGLTSAKDGDTIVDYYPELKYVNADESKGILPILQPLPDIPSLLYAIVQQISQQEKDACLKIYDQPPSFFDKKKSLNYGVEYVLIQDAPFSLRSSPKKADRYDPNYEALRQQLGSPKDLYHKSRGSDPGGRHAEYEDSVAERAAKAGAAAAELGLKRSLSRGDRPQAKRGKSDEPAIDEDSSDEEIARRLPSSLHTPADSDDPMDD